jgi:rubrerythrin
MSSQTPEALAAEVTRGGQASVRNLALAEAAVVRGQFNLAKVLRALAHAQRVQALLAARRLAEVQDLDMALDTIAAEVAVAPPVALGANAVAVRERALDIVRRSQTSLATHSDVSETAIAQLLWGCYGCGWLIEGDRPDACPVCGALAVEFEAFEPFYSRTAEHLGQLPPSEILAILQGGPERVAAAFASLDETQLRTKPSPEEWSPKEIVGHLLEVERLFVRRVQAVLASEPPAMLDSPVPPWKLHIGVGYEDMPALELLVRFRKTREDTVALVAELQPADWGRTGTVGGTAVTVVDLGTWLANHDRGHLAQLERPPSHEGTDSAP